MFPYLVLTCCVKLALFLGQITHEQSRFYILAKFWLIDWCFDRMILTAVYNCVAAILNVVYFISLNLPTENYYSRCFIFNWALGSPWIYECRIWFWRVLVVVRMASAEGALEPTPSGSWLARGRPPPVAFAATSVTGCFPEKSLSRPIKEHTRVSCDSHNACVIHILTAEGICSTYVSVL